MIITVRTAVWPGPIVIDTDAPAGEGGALLSIVRPAVDVRLTPGTAPIATWAPKGEPGESLVPLAVLIGLGLIATLAIVGLVKVAR